MDTIKQDDIDEGNILICEFMERKFFPYKGNRYWTIPFNTYKECLDHIEKYNLKGYTPEVGWKKGNGSYHKDYHELMNVLERILLFDEKNINEIRLFGNVNDAKFMAYSNFGCFTNDKLIEVIWLSVVEWIKLNKYRNDNGVII